MKRERKRGATGLLLDSDKLAALIRAAEPDWDGQIRADRQILVTTKDEGLAVVCIEGVGWVVKDGKVVVSVSFGFSSDTYELPIEDVQACATDEVIDLADHVRTFGDRLEVNHSIWYRKVVG